MDEQTLPGTYSFLGARIFCRTFYCTVLCSETRIFCTSMDCAYLMSLKSTANGNYLKKCTTESKEKKIWSKGKLRPDQFVGMSGGFCLSNTISNNFNKGGKRLKAPNYNNVLRRSIKQIYYNQ